MRIVGKPWGSEFIWAENSLYVGKFLTFKPGCETSLHYHTDKDETIIMTEGSGFIQFDEQMYTLYKTGPWRIPAGIKHRFIAGPNGLTLTEVSSPETGTTVRVQDLHGRGDEVFNARTDGGSR